MSLPGSSVYCICRSKDSTGFMIGCDNCNEWYHENCVNISEEEAALIKSYACPLCIEKDPTKITVYLDPEEFPEHVKLSIKKKEKELKRKELNKLTTPKSTTKSKPSGSGPGPGRKRKYDRRLSYESKDARKEEKCERCNRYISCGKCKACKSVENLKDCLKRQCYCEIRPYRGELIKSRSEEEEWEPDQPVNLKKGKKLQKRRGQYSKSNKNDTKGGKRKKFASKVDYSSSNDSAEQWKKRKDEPRQCRGLDCVKAAVHPGKYCSESCGINVATERIYNILPSRLSEWKLTPCISDENNRKALADINEKQNTAKRLINELEARRSEIDKHIEKVRAIRLSPDHVEDDSDDEGNLDDGMVCCVSCGHDVAMKNCLKHFERCFNKFESQMSFGSLYESKLEGAPIFCDFYNPLNNTYCKRLKVLCPEHMKEPKVEIEEVCGAPQHRAFIINTKEYCKIRKKDCNRHYGWEKLHRAELDLERVRQWLKLDELADQERQLKYSLECRMGLLGLLLNSTFNHEVREKAVEEQLQAEQLQEDKTDYDEPQMDKSKPSFSSKEAESVLDKDITHSERKDTASSPDSETDSADSNDN